MARKKEEKSLEAVEGEDALKKCPDCGSDKVEYKNGEHYCGKCGLVLDW
ncbi:hypothetical protein J4212_01450 [Candidatus Woesearchaeota archaeon]|nr:hypothetical protein [Candidatus Woesearchaeota archaeon]